MRYDSEKLYNQAVNVAKDEKCIFIDQLVSFLPCARKTFYELYPIDSDKSNTIKEILEKNKISLKTKLYKKWEDSDNATLQVALMKLIATEEEAHRLNGSKQEVKQTGDIKVQYENVSKQFPNK